MAHSSTGSPLASWGLSRQLCLQGSMPQPGIVAHNGFATAMCTRAAAAAAGWQLPCRRLCRASHVVSASGLRTSEKELTRKYSAMKPSTPYALSIDRQAVPDYSRPSDIELIISAPPHDNNLKFSDTSVSRQTQVPKATTKGFKTTKQGASDGSLAAEPAEDGGVAQLLELIPKR